MKMIAGIVGGFALLVSCSGANAQATNIALAWQTIGTGTIVQTGGNFELVGAIELATAAPMTGSGFAMAGDLSLGAQPEHAPCVADCNADGLLNLVDYLCFNELFAQNIEAADLTGDAVFNIFDMIAFGDAFSEGCN